MTVPMQYAHASERFERFMRDAQTRLDRVTSHQTYQSVHAVLRVFRRRLTPQEGLDFANVLPAVLRAIFVEDWDLSEPVRPFASRTDLTREVQQVRVNHNLSPDTVIADIAVALRSQVDPVAFEACLGRIGPEARDFWAV